MSKNNRIIFLFYFLFSVPLLYAQSPPPTSIFTEPYIDREESRELPVKHKYIHGGFKGTDTRFSFYMPVSEKYEGRFFQYITPAPDNEYLSQGATGEEDRIGFALSHGAYFIETNGGGSSAFGNLTGAYEANAACAKYSRIVAATIYGEHRPFGYAFGGSGGGYRTIGGMENTETWDGAVPFVIGSDMAIPNVFSIRMHAMRILKEKFPQIIDALEPGGSGNMYEGLTRQEAAALQEVTRMGFPPKSWFGYKTMGVHGFTAIYPGMVAADPDYFNHDFWNTEGYLGADSTSSIHTAHIRCSSRIKTTLSEQQAVEEGLISPLLPNQRGSADAAWKSLGKPEGTWPVAFCLEDTLPDIDFLGGDLLVKSGKASGQIIQLAKIEKDKVVFHYTSPQVLAAIQSGDEVEISNSNFLAAQTYHRHQIPPGDNYPVWNQFKNADGTPLYPQRPLLLGPLFTRSAAGILPGGKFRGKMIVVCCLWDREAYPWQGDWYRSRVKEQLGEETDSRFRLWYVDRALHGDFTSQEDPTRTVSYIGVLQQALLDVSNWVENGIAPPATTGYRIEDGQVILPPSAAARKGIQPIVTLHINKENAIEINTGEEFTLKAEIDLPPDSGQLISVEWSFENGDFHPSLPLATTITHTYTQPGTYFPTVRIVTQRKGNPDTPYTRIYNLERVRVVVK